MGDWDRIEGQMPETDPEQADTGATTGESGLVQEDAPDVWDATKEPGATAGTGAWRDETEESGGKGEGAIGDFNETGGVWDEAADMTGEGMEEFEERT